MEDKNVYPIGTKVATWISGNPKTAILFALLVLGIFIPGIAKIQTEFSVRIWLGPESQKIKNLDAFEKQFGSDETIVVAIYNKNGVFNKKTMRIAQDLTEKFWNIHSVIRVESLTNYNWISSEGDDILIEPFIDDQVELELTDKLLALKKIDALKDSNLPNKFVSPDGTLAVVLGHLKPAMSLEESSKFESIVQDVKQIISKLPQDQDMEYHILGVAAVNDGYRSVSAADLRRIIPVLVICLILIMLYNFRSVIAVMLSFGLILITIAITFGFEGLIGIKYNSLISALPGVMVAICIADSVHIISSFFDFLREGDDNKLAAFKSLRKNFQPTLLTSVTTTVGFFSLLQANIVPIHDLGLLCGFGCMIAWIITYTFVGGALVALPIKLRFKKRVDTSKYRLLDPAKIMLVLKKYKLWIIIIFVLVNFAAIIVGMTNDVNSDPLKHFALDLDIRKSYDFFADKMTAGRAIELVIDSGAEDGIKDPDFLKNVASYSSWIKERDYVVYVHSVVDIVKKMNQTLHGNDLQNYVIPDSRRAVADIMFLYTMGLPQGMDLNNQVTLDNRSIRVWCGWDVEDTKNQIAKSDELIGKAKEFGLQVHQGGQMPIYMHMNSEIVSTFFSSIAMTFLLVGIFILCVFRDFKLAILGMLPNIIPLGFGTGLMVVLGKEINIGTAIVCSVCLGIAVDDTIHFITSYKNRIAEGASVEDSLLHTFIHTGKALIVTTILLMVGFGSFMLGDFVPNQNFGMLCACILAMALITDLVFLPAILLQFDKNRK